MSAQGSRLLEISSRWGKSSSLVRVGATILEGILLEPTGVHNVPFMELSLFLVSSHPRDTLTHGVHYACVRSHRASLVPAGVQGSGRGLHL